MKSMFLRCITASFILFSSTSWALSFQALEGTYKVTTPSAPVENIITISKTGEVKLTEVSPLGQLTCEGQAFIEETLLVSEVTCDNGLSFTQVVELRGVTDFTYFSASVYSSLYDVEVGMDFERL